MATVEFKAGSKFGYLTRKRSTSPRAKAAWVRRAITLT